MRQLLCHKLRTLREVRLKADGIRPKVHEASVDVRGIVLLFVDQLPDFLQHIFKPVGFGDVAGRARFH